MSHTPFPHISEFNSVFGVFFFLSLDPFLPYVRAHFSHISPFNSFFQVIIADGESNEDVVIKVTARPPTPLPVNPS